MPSRGCPLPPDGPGMRIGEEPLRRRFYRGAGCGVVFWICRHCDRGTNTAASAAGGKRGG